MKSEKIYVQHTENNEWANNIAFYRDELKIMVERLAEVTMKNTSKEILKQVEHFQNQFFIQKTRLDTIKHGINLSDDSLNREIKKNPIALERRSMEDHTGVRDEMKRFEELFASLKKEFNLFLKKYM